MREGVAGHGSSRHQADDGDGGTYRGPVLPVMVRLAAPILLGMVFQILYGIVDTFWISRIDPGDPSYVGGVGVILPLFFLVIALGSGVLIGMSSLVARSIGARDRSVLERVLGAGLFVGVTLAVLLVFLGYAYAERIIGGLGARGSYAVHALEYLRFVLPAGALMLVGNVFNGIIMGEGRMKHIMIAVVIATLSNCALDPLFIFALGLGVRGAGLATVTAQLVAAVYILRLFTGGKTTVPLNLKRGMRRLPVVMRIAAIGFPHAAGQLSVSLSYLIFNRILIGIDPQAVTAFTLYSRFEQILLMPILSLGTAMITMVGQNYGAGNYRRISVIWRTGLGAAAVVVGLLSALIMATAPAVYPLFSEVDEVVSYAVRQTRIVMPSFVFVSAVVLSRSTFLALGRPAPAVAVNVLRSVGVAAPSALLFSIGLRMGVGGVWLGMVAGNVLIGAAALVWTGAGLRTVAVRH